MSRSVSLPASVSWIRIGRTAFFALGLLCAAVLLTGCGGAGIAGKNKISGKITVGGKPPAAGSTIHFYASDGKELATSSLDTDGAFMVLDVPLGDTKVAVKGMVASAVAGPGASSAGMTGMGAAGGAPIPTKYATPGTAPNANVVKGNTKYDTDLAP